MIEREYIWFYHVIIVNDKFENEDCYGILTASHNTYAVEKLNSYYGAIYDIKELKCVDLPLVELSNNQQVYIKLKNIFLDADRNDKYKDWGRDE